jgi:acetylornithine deacetylase
MNEPALHIISSEAIGLLQQLIAVPSLSKQEEGTATLINDFLQAKNISANRSRNNVWCVNEYFDPARPSILLNSHHDTVPANAHYTNDPYQPITRDGKLFGLGSTDAGASLVSLLSAFLFFYNRKGLAYNIIFAATAEEEISGQNGIASLFSDEHFSACFTNGQSFAIIGEPTQLDLAVAEKGLLVVDCTVTGKAGHAAGEEGDNAIYKAMQCMDWIRQYRFEKISPLLGEVKMSVTVISTANTSHNIIPAECSFVLDIRVNERYTHEEIVQTLTANLDAEIVPRSTRLRSSFIPQDHPVVQAGLQLGKRVYGSPTLSDKALVPLPALKCGPGNSAQSHSADEYVLMADVEEGILFYTQLLQLLINNA